MAITDNRDINLVGANAVSMQVKTMQNTLLSHVSNGPDSDDDALTIAAIADAARASVDDVSHRARVTLAYADALYKQNSYQYSQVTARSDSLRMARRDVGLLWNALATCGLVVTEETEPFNAYFAPDTAFAALRRILAELDHDLVECPSMEGMFPLCIFPNPYHTGFAIEQTNYHGEPDCPGYTGAYIKINRDGSVAFVSAARDEDVAR